MAFNDEKAYLQPVLSGVHVWNGAQWVPWDGVLSTGDIEIGAVELKDATSTNRAIVSASGQLNVHESSDTTVDHGTGAAAVSMTVAPGVAWKLHELRIHLSAAGTAGNLTITVGSGTAAAYNTVILTQDMTAIVDFVWQPARPMRFAAGDSITISWANASTRTYGIEVVRTNQ